MNYLAKITLPKSVANYRVEPVRFGSVTVRLWNGSSGSGFRFRRFLYKKGFSVFQYSLPGKDGSSSGFGSWKTVPAVPLEFGFGKNGSDGSGSRFLSHPVKFIAIRIRSETYCKPKALSKKQKSAPGKWGRPRRGSSSF